MRPKDSHQSRHPKSEKFPCQASRQTLSMLKNVTTRVQSFNYSDCNDRFQSVGPMELSRPRAATVIIPQ